MSAYKHIIWDWNGTLWNDSWLCREITNKMLVRRGLPELELERYQEVMDFPIEDYYQNIGFDFDKEPYKELAVEFIDEYESRRFECELQDGVVELLELVKSHKLPQAVLSAYKHDTLLQAVRHYKLTGYFSEIIGLNDIYAISKVENGKTYMRNLGVDPSDVLFIGDTTHDYEVASAMGVNCVLVFSGHNSRRRLEDCNVPVLDSLLDIKTFPGLFQK